MKTLLLTFASFTLVASATFAHADLHFSNFSDTTGLTLNGNATTQNGSLSLTQAGQYYQASAVWANTRQSVTNGFDTSFTYHIGEGDGADGLAFVIQNDDPTQLGAMGGGLGMNNIDKAFGVEFRTYIYNSVDYNFYTYNSGMPSAADANLRGDHSVRIKYSGGILNVYMDGSSTALLSSAIDLSQYVNTTDGKAYVGFTSGTGGSTDNHLINSWNFKGGSVQAVPEPASMAVLATGALGLLRRRRKA